WRVAPPERAAVATLAEPQWIERAPGLETADADVSLAGQRVDSVALVRLAPARYELSVHWAGDQPLAIDDWQRTQLGASCARVAAARPGWEANASSPLPGAVARPALHREHEQPDRTHRRSDERHV